MPHGKKDRRCVAAQHCIRGMEWILPAGPSASGERDAGKVGGQRAVTALCTALVSGACRPRRGQCCTCSGVSQRSRGRGAPHRLPATFTNSLGPAPKMPGRGFGCCPCPFPAVVLTQRHMVVSQPAPSAPRRLQGLCLNRPWKLGQRQPYRIGQKVIFSVSLQR